MRALDRVVEALDQHGLKYKWHGHDELHAVCPSHEDHNPSLAIRQIGERTLCYCHAGCQTSDVLAALDLSAADLFDNRREEVYQYADGRRVHRSPDKKFWQEVPEGGSVTLFTPPQLNLAAAVEQGMAIWLTEGESDTLALAGKGVPAVSAPMGAPSWEKCDYSPLTNARRLVIVQDKDDPGRARGAGLYHHLREVTKAEVVVVEAATGKDATEHILAGRTVDEFVRVIMPDTQAEVELPDGTRIIVEEDSDIPLIPPSWLWRDIIPFGSLTIFAGRGGSRKSTFAVWLASQLQQGVLHGRTFRQEARILVISSEDSWQTITVPRFVANGGQRGAPHLFKRIGIELHVRGGKTGRRVPTVPKIPMDLELLREKIEAEKATFVIIDPLIRMLEDGKSIDSIPDARSVCDPLNALADELGIAIIGIMHVNKSAAASLSDRLSGSSGWRDAPRALLLFAKDPDAPETSLITINKMNAGEEGASYSFVQDTVPVTFDEPDDDGQYTHLMPRLTFVGPSDRSVNDANAAEAEAGRSGELKNAIVEYVISRTPDLVTTKEVANEMKDLFGTQYGSVRTALTRLAKSGRLKRYMNGAYGSPNTQSSTANFGDPTMPVTPLCVVCHHPLPAAVVRDGFDRHPTC